MKSQNSKYFRKWNIVVIVFIILVLNSIVIWYIFELNYANYINDTLISDNREVDCYYYLSSSIYQQEIDQRYPNFDYKSEIHDQYLQIQEKANFLDIDLFYFVDLIIHLPEQTNPSNSEFTQVPSINFRIVVLPDSFSNLTLAYTNLFNFDIKDEIIDKYNSHLPFFFLNMKDEIEIDSILQTTNNNLSSFFNGTSNFSCSLSNAYDNESKDVTFSNINWVGLNSSERMNDEEILNYNFSVQQNPNPFSKNSIDKKRYLIYVSNLDFQNAVQYGNCGIINNFVRGLLFVNFNSKIIGFDNIIALDKFVHNPFKDYNAIEIYPVIFKNDFVIDGIVNFLGENLPTRIFVQIFMQMIWFFVGYQICRKYIKNLITGNDVLFKISNRLGENLNIEISKFQKTGFIFPYFIKSQMKKIVLSSIILIIIYFLIRYLVFFKVFNSNYRFSPVSLSSLCIFVISGIYMISVFLNIVLTFTDSKHLKTLQITGNIISERNLTKKKFGSKHVFKSDSLKLYKGLSSIRIKKNKFLNSIDFRVLKLILISIIMNFIYFAIVFFNEKYYSIHLNTNPLIDYFLTIILIPLFFIVQSVMYVKTVYYVVLDKLNLISSQIQYILKQFIHKIRRNINRTSDIYKKIAKIPVKTTINYSIVLFLSISFSFMDYNKMNYEFLKDNMNFYVGSENQIIIDNIPLSNLTLFESEITSSIEISYEEMHGELSYFTISNYHEINLASSQFTLELNQKGSNIRNISLDNSQLQFLNVIFIPNLDTYLMSLMPEYQNTIQTLSERGCIINSESMYSKSFSNFQIQENFNVMNMVISNQNFPVIDVMNEFPGCLTQLKDNINVDLILFGTNDLNITSLTNITSIREHYLFRGESNQSELLTVNTNEKLRGSFIDQIFNYLNSSLSSLEVENFIIYPRLNEYHNDDLNYFIRLFPSSQIIFMKSYLSYKIPFLAISVLLVTAEFYRFTHDTISELELKFFKKIKLIPNDVINPKKICSVTLALQLVLASVSLFFVIKLIGYTGFLLISKPIFID